MPPKKNQKQPFFFFMKDYQEKARSRGEFISMDQLVTKLHPKWQKMAAEEKEPFEEMSRAAKGKRAESNEGILTSFGRPVKEEMEEAMEAEDLQQYLEKMVEIAVEAPDSDDDLMSKNFFLISFNVMVKTQDDQYYPLEIGLVEYSVKEGIKKEFHKFIDPGKVPEGYAGLAKQHMESSHKIPLWGFTHAEGKNNPKETFEAILLDMIDMMKPSRIEVNGKQSSMMVFSAPGAPAEQIKGCLKFMAQKTQQPELMDAIENEILVLDMTWLLFHLCRKAGQVRPYAICKRDFDVSTYDYSENTNCALFHDEIDNRYCALGFAKRWCYMLSDVLCKTFDIKPTNKHLPLRENQSLTYTTYEGNLNTRSYNAPRNDRTFDPRQQSQPQHLSQGTSGPPPAYRPQNQTTEPFRAPRSNPGPAAAPVRDPRDPRNRLLGVGRGNPSRLSPSQ